MASDSVGYDPDAIFRSKLNCDKAIGKWRRVSGRGARFSEGLFHWSQPRPTLSFMPGTRHTTPLM